MKMRYCLMAATLTVAISGPSLVLANGLGEDRPYQFRSANERQVSLNAERTRLELQGKFPMGVGSSAGLGGTQQTGNDLIITINGNGNNTIDVGQTNNGDQTAQDSDQSSSNILNN